MAEFLVEVYLSAARVADVGRWVDAASTAAVDVAREGTPVRYVRSIVVPADETWFLIFEAPSIEAVRETAHRAGLGSGRIAETLVHEAWEDRS